MVTSLHSEIAQVSLLQPKVTSLHTRSDFAVHVYESDFPLHCTRMYIYMHLRNYRHFSKRVVNNGLVIANLIQFRFITS